MTSFVRNRALASYVPGVGELRVAPLLQRWHVDDERAGDGAALFGVRAQDRARVETATILALDPERRWARTNGGGLWRLGEPADPKRVRHPSLLAWRTETAERADEVYFQMPPPELVPARDLYDDVLAWRQLAEWYDERPPAGESEFCVYLALRTGMTPGEAYMASDTFSKDRLGLRGFN